MKTRKRERNTSILTRKQKLVQNSPIIQKLLCEYEDLLIELLTKKDRVKREFIECQKWRPIPPSYFCLKSKVYPHFDSSIYHMRNGQILIEKAKGDLNVDIQKIHKEWIHVHSICEFEYRKKHGLLHTMPMKKIKMFETIYPDIRARMMLSKRYFKTNTCVPPKSPKCVRFSGYIYKK